MEDSATCCSRPILKLKLGDIHGFLWWTSWARDILRGQILVRATFGKQNWRWLPPSVCPTSKSPPCVPAPHPHVFTRVDVLPVHKGTFWMYTRGVLSESPHTPQPQPQPHTTTQTTTTTTTHNDTQPTNLQLHSTQHGKTHQVQTQQGLTDCSLFFWCFDGVAWPFFSADGVISLVTSFHEREPSGHEHAHNNNNYSFFKFQTCQLTIT